ncbi:MAG: hypothetical protein ACOY3P_19495 [Planctomycetota bacterium]
MQTKTYVEHGTRVCEQLTPAGYAVIDTYHPCPTVTPWDYHGMKHQREFAYVLRSAGIECLCLITTRTILHPRGTGVNGAVRFGDDMTPGEYRIAVPEAQAQAAREAIDAHKKAIDRWLFTNGPMPEACRL